MNIAEHKITLRSNKSIRPVFFVLFIFILFVSGNSIIAGESANTAEPSSNEKTGKRPASSSLDAGDYDVLDPKEAGRGGQVYLEHCASCHDVGVGHAPQRAALSMMSPFSIYKSLTSGVMADMVSQLSANDKKLVSEYLSKREMEDGEIAREPPICENGVNRIDFGRPPELTGWGLSLENNRFVPANTAKLTKSDIGHLELKWAVSFPNSVRVRSQPAFAGGMIFVGSHNGNLYALDEKTGCAHWIVHVGAEIRTGIVISPWKLGDETANPKAFFGDLVGNVYAVEILSGEIVWKKRADSHPNATITGTPTLYNGILYAPVSSMEVIRPADPGYECCNARGSVVAYDADTGNVIWKTFMISNEPSLQGKNSDGTRQFGPSGASVWNSPTIDIARQQLYVGTGQNNSRPATKTSDAVVALDLLTGEKRWVFQAMEDDVWNNACITGSPANCPENPGKDFDFGANTSLVRDSSGRDLILAGQKSGHAFALNPDTGEMVWRAKPGRGGILGGIHFGVATGNNRLYAPVFDAFDDPDLDEEARPGIYALNIDDGSTIWEAPAPTDTCDDLTFCMPGYSQAITATPEMVIAGSVDGWLRILASDTGKLLWSVDTKQEVDTVNGIKARGGSMGGGAAPVVYNGVLYISSGYGFGGQMPGNVLLAYSPVEYKKDTK